MKCGPDECPITAFSDLTPAEQRVARKRTAEKMSRQGFTQEQIAKQLGVSKATISGDLSNCSTTEQLKPAKTASNPKGAGRRKGSGTKASKAKKSRAETAPQAVEREERVAILMDQGKTTTEIAAELGVGQRATNQAMEHVRIKREAEPLIDPASLSMTAQARLATVIKQATRRLEVEIEQRVRSELMKWLQKMLDQYNENARDAERVLRARRGLLSGAEYKLIWSCLHEDSRKSASEDKLKRAFQLWGTLAKVLVSEKESPTKPSGLPTTAQEMLKRKAEYQAQRAAERAAKNGAAATPARRAS